MMRNRYERSYFSFLPNIVIFRIKKTAKKSGAGMGPYPSHFLNSRIVCTKGPEKVEEEEEEG
jgi:hypothetical protein